MHEDNASGTNTVLIVIVLLIIVGFGVWWFTTRGPAVPADSNPDTLNVDINYPADSNTPAQ